MASRAMILDAPGPATSPRLRLVERPVPEPGPGELLVAVEVCGVCRTDLHLVEGDLAPRRPHVVPGHEVVGTVAALGPDASGSAVGDRVGIAIGERVGIAVGDRVGIAWLHAACGRCRFCLAGAENLCLAPRFTGWDVDGGYADHVVVPAPFAYPLPTDVDAAALAPLLCAGIIGWRAYRRSGARRGMRLGLYGFGGSAHIVLQLARADGCEVYVMTRGESHRALADRLGAVWVGASDATPPVKLDAAILFAPVGTLVPTALAALDRGGRLAIAGIHLSTIPPLDYAAHLFEERELVSVTANTRADGHALLERAAAIPLRCTTQSFALADANDALRALREDRIDGAAVLRVGGPAPAPSGK